MAMWVITRWYKYWQMRSGLKCIEKTWASSSHRPMPSTRVVILVHGARHVKNPPKGLPYIQPPLIWHLKQETSKYTTFSNHNHLDFRVSTLLYSCVYWILLEGCVQWNIDICRGGWLFSTGGWSASVRTSQVKTRETCIVLSKSKWQSA